MTETEDGGGHFTEVTLCPIVAVTEQPMVKKANALHGKANELCFIAKAVNFRFIIHQLALLAPQNSRT